MSLLLEQKSLYVCTGCGWFGTARKLGLKALTTGSTSSNNHASRRPDCQYGPCLVRSTERTPGQSRKQDAAAYLARCTPEQRALGMPPTGGCAPCMPTPEGRPDGDQWVAVQIPEGVEPGGSFEHLNHNGRYMMTVTVPEGAKAGEILGTPSGNKRRRSDRVTQQRAERQAATVERATAERDAAEIAADAQAATERATDERAAAKRAADAEAKRLAAEIAARSNAHSVAGDRAQGQGGGPTGEVGDTAGGGEGGSGATSAASAHGGGESAQGSDAGFTIYGDIQPLTPNSDPDLYPLTPAPTS